MYERLSPAKPEILRLRKELRDRGTPARDVGQSGTADGGREVDHELSPDAHEAREPALAAPGDHPLVASGHGRHLFRRDPPILAEQNDAACRHARQIGRSSKTPPIPVEGAGPPLLKHREARR